MTKLGGFISTEESFFEEEDSDDIQLEMDSSYYDKSESEKGLYHWNLYYYFTSAVRNNKPNGKTYGSKGMTFQRLFKILIHHNEGVNFIDNYIETILPATTIGEKMESWLSYAEESVIYMYDSLPKRKDGNIDRRYKRDIKSYIDLTAELEAEQREKGKSLAREIKADIEAKISTGTLPLSPAWNTFATKIKRLRADLPMNPRFYASKQFIKNMRMVCKFEKRSGAWTQDTLA